MFASKANYLKLRTNLRLCINRFKLLEKKKTELALKARKEIADYIAAGKEDRARIRVEHIVREDYLVEAMEIVEMLCDLLLARFGLIEKMAELDPGLEEAISTLIWVTPRLSADVQELREVTHQLTMKYGKEYAEMCRSNGFQTVNEKVIHKMSLAAPPKILVENYMIEIAKSYKVPFEPDPEIMMGKPPETNDLIELGVDSLLAGGGSPSHGGTQSKHQEAAAANAANSLSKQQEADASRRSRPPSYFPGNGPHGGAGGFQPNGGGGGSGGGSGPAVSSSGWKLEVDGVTAPAGHGANYGEDHTYMQLVYGDQNASPGQGNVAPHGSGMSPGGVNNNGVGVKPQGPGGAVPFPSAFGLPGMAGPGMAGPVGPGMGGPVGPGMAGPVGPGMGGPFGPSSAGGPGVGVGGGFVAPSNPTYNNYVAVGGLQPAPPSVPGTSPSRMPPPLPSRPPNSAVEPSDPRAHGLFFSDDSIDLPMYDDVMRRPDEYPPTLPRPGHPASASPPHGGPFPTNGPSPPQGPSPSHYPTPMPRNITTNPPGNSAGFPDLPILPDVPGMPSVPSDAIGSSSVGGDGVDFDDLTRRFEELKRRK